MEILIALAVLAIIFGTPILLVVILHYASRPLVRAVRNHDIEKQLREEVADVEAQERAARKLLRERGL